MLAEPLFVCLISEGGVSPCGEFCFRRASCRSSGCTSRFVSFISPTSRMTDDGLSSTSVSSTFGSCSGWGVAALLLVCVSAGWGAGSATSSEAPASSGSP